MTGNVNYNGSPRCNADQHDRSNDPISHLVVSILGMLMLHAQEVFVVIAVFGIGANEGALLGWLGTTGWRQLDWTLWTLGC